jgi:hypothetical protein
MRRWLQPWARRFCLKIHKKYPGDARMSRVDLLIYDWAIWAICTDSLDHHPWVTTLLIYWHYHMPWNASALQDVALG